MKNQGDSYYTRPYRVNPKVRDLIRKQLGKDDELSYVRAENIVKSVIRGEYKKALRKFSDEDKKKLMNVLKSAFSTSLQKKSVLTMAKFIKDNFDSNEIEDFASFCIEKYKPGMIVMGVRVSNSSVSDMLDELGTHKMYRGIIINKRYVNDIIPFLSLVPDDVEYDEKTLLTGNDYTKEIVSDACGIDGVLYHNDDDIFVIASDDADIQDEIEKKYDGLRMQLIPVDFFEWKTRKNKEK